MSMSTSTWIVIATVVAVPLIAALIVAASRAMRRRRQRQAAEIREQAQLATARVERRQALADETAAKARAAQAEAEVKAAEAEVKAAEAARLQEQAAKHHSDPAASRQQLQEQWKRADSIDPEVKNEAPRQPGTDAQAVEQGYRASSG
jgi:Na+-transporting NADH:ubiquinone oxidoreductase subunit NqrC